LKNGICRIIIEGEAPSVVAVKARELFEKVRGVVEPTKDFKRDGGSTRSD